MFIEIKPHEGVRTENSDVFDRINAMKQSYRLNLNFVREIHFEEAEYFDRTGQHSITFIVMTGYEQELAVEEFSLYFSKEGEGEFQRIRRIIDENTFK